MVKLNQVLDAQEDGPQGVFNNILTHLAGGSDRHGVGVDHAEALLEDGPLRLGRGDFLFSVVTNAVVLEVFVNYEHGSKIYFSYNSLT